MIGIYALADRRADDAFLAAVPTVIGYSVMDTIVISIESANTRSMAGAPDDDCQRVDQADDDAFVQHAATVITTLVALLGVGRSEPQGTSPSRRRRHLLGRDHRLSLGAVWCRAIRERQMRGRCRNRRARRSRQDRTVTARSRSEAASLSEPQWRRA